MTVRELYEWLSERYPAALRAEWDHDGLMCSSDPDGAVLRVLCTLDVTEGTVAYAKACGANVILSHHPLLFHPIDSLTPDTAVGRKLVSLISSGISVLSFHTRADAAKGGVNDLLAEALSLADVSPFAEGLGRVGEFPFAEDASAFAKRVADLLGAPAVTLGDAGHPVRRVAVLGGSGKGEIAAALQAGADTFLSGRLSYESVNEASELGINLVEAGHFYTEALLPKNWVRELCALGLEAEYYDSCNVRVIGRDH